MALYLVKDRRQQPGSVTRRALRQHLDNGLFWARVQGPLRPLLATTEGDAQAAALRKQFPHHELLLIDDSSPWDVRGRIVPCKARAALVSNDRIVATACLQYATFCLHPPGETKGGDPATSTPPLVSVATDVARPADDKFAGFERERRVHFSAPDGSYEVFLFMELNGPQTFAPYVCKDDVTGEAYVYVLKRVVLAVPAASNKAASADSQTSAPAAPAAVTGDAHS